MLKEFFDNGPRDEIEEGLYTEPVGAVAKTIFSDVAKELELLLLKLV